MADFLFAFTIFGRELTWNVSTTVLLLICLEIALIVFVMVIFVILILRKYLVNKGRQNILVAQAETVRKGRTLLGITLDTAVVKREFKIGEIFNCDGLLVTANYSEEPVNEIVNDYKVDEPSLDEEGKPIVTVRYKGVSAAYPISVTRAEEYYDQSEPEVKPNRYLTGITLDTSIVQREFTVGEKFNSDGLVVTATYSAEPTTEYVTDYEVDAPDMNEEGKPYVIVRYGDFTSMYTVSVEPKPEEIEEPKVRELIGITLDTTAVKREFLVGDEFNCDGLIVIANYSEEPKSEYVFDFEVDAPTLDEEGKPYVVVRYGDMTAAYSIAVTAPIIEEPVTETIEEQVERPQRNLVSIELDTSKVKTEFTDRDTFDCEGLKVIAHYNIEPLTENVVDFTVDAPDISREGRAEAVVHYGDFIETYPVFVTRSRRLVGISLDTGVVQREFELNETFNSIGLIVTANYDAAPFSEQVSDYEIIAPDMSEEGKPMVTVSYLGKSAIYTIAIVKPFVKEEIAATKQEIIIDEESYEGGILRYDRSFTARLIQSDDEIKQWYTILKNELLSYKKVKDRMSWKKETFRYGKVTVAKFGYRGKMLCLFLALEPSEYIDSKYKLEDVSDNKSYEDTPCMYRIKNDRRVKYAIELIAVIMERLDAKKYSRESVDYYLPYEGVVELINKGLIKRNIKTSADEAIFTTHTDGESTVITQRPVSDEEIEQTIEVVEETAPDQTEEVVEEPTPEQAEEVVEETAPDQTEEVVEEPTPEQAEEVVEEPTPDQTEEVVEESTPEQAEEVVEEPTPDQAEEVVEESTPEQTIEVVEETTPEQTIEVVEETMTEQTEEVVEETTPDQNQSEQEVAATEIEEPVEEENVIEVTPAEELDIDIETEGDVSYDFGFRARLIQSDDATKARYSRLKNELLSYMKVRYRIDWKNELFRVEKERAAKFGFADKTLCLFLPLDPKSYSKSKYIVKDASLSTNFGDTPLMFRVENYESVAQACELIADVMAKLNVPKLNHLDENFYEPYMNNATLLKKGYIKPIEN